MKPYFLAAYIMMILFTIFVFWEMVDNAPQESVVVEENLPQESVESDIFDSSRDLECMALNIYHEARSDNFAGKIAVADVVLNRVDSSRYPNTVCEVVEQSRMRTNWKGNIVPVKNMCQFSWFCDGLSDEPFDEGAWIESTNIAEISLNQDKYRGITEGSTHYHASYVTPKWINDRGMQVVGQIGQHKFYRWQ